MRSGQHDAYPEETLEDKGWRCAEVVFVMNVIVVFLNNPRYIFIVRRLSIFGINLTVYEQNSIS